MGKRLILQSYLIAALFAFAVIGVSTIVFADTATTAVDVGNAAPTVTNVNISASPIVLIEYTSTTALYISATITDTNGCSDVISSGTVVGTLFREGVSSTCTQSPLSCYRNITMVASSSDLCSGGSDTTADVFATTGVWYFADPTDASSSYPGEKWFLSVKATDAANASSTATDTTASELNTLVALNTTSAIVYGSVSPGSNTGATNQNGTTTNTGNAIIDIEFTVANMTSGPNTLQGSQQKYGTTSVTYASLPYTGSSTATVRDWNVGKTATSTTDSASSTFWGIAVPSGQASGTYSGTNTFVAVWSSA